MGKLSNFFDLFKRNSLLENNIINDNSILNEHENVEYNLKENDYNSNQIDNNENISTSKELRVSNYSLNNTFSNESDFLKLFKYDSIADSSKTFNIETALNNNWDKVDNFAKDVSQQMEHKADLVDGKVSNSQLPEINSSADKIKIDDTVGNFTADNVEGALAECFQSANNGKTAIRTALSNKGVMISLEDTFTLLASKITAQMCKFGGTAVVTDVLSGKTFINNGGEILTGTMANQGAKSASLNAGGSYTIPKGYHNGNGVISANSLVSQTSGTATVGNILSGYTAWVGGIKITGTMPNNGAVTSTLTTQGVQYTIPAGYHNGSGKVTANISNLVADNIKKGISVGGVVGTAEFTVQTYEKTITLTSSQYDTLPSFSDNNRRKYTLSGLPFTPDKVEYYGYHVTTSSPYKNFKCFGTYDSHSTCLGWGTIFDSANTYDIKNALQYSGLHVSNAIYEGFGQAGGMGVVSISLNTCDIIVHRSTYQDYVIVAKFYKYGN